MSYKAVMIAGLAFIFFMTITRVTAEAINLGSMTPRIYRSEGDLLINGNYLNISNTTLGEGPEYSDLFFTEKVQLTTVGYVYHPNFMQFYLRLSLGLGQERFSGNAFAADDSTKFALMEEYDIRTIFLPEKPYNLELYTMRANPFFRGGYIGGYETVSYNSGGLFKYKKRPYTFILSYNQSNFDQLTGTTDTDTFRMSAGYAKAWGTFSGAYFHTTTDTSPDLGSSTHITLDTYTFGNVLNFSRGKAILQSYVTQSDLSQETRLISIDDQRLTWTENLKMALPLRFDAGIFNRYMKSDYNTSRSEDGLERKQTVTNNTSGFFVDHQLYNSLRTSYNFTYATNEGPAGDIDTTTNTFISTYTKAIPRGFVTASIRFGNIDSERKGAPEVVSEPFQTSLFGEFELPDTQISEPSIRIRVKSPETGILSDYLARDFHYLVLWNGSHLRIRIISLPEEARSPDPFYSGAYEFLVSYALTPLDNAVETKTFGFSLRFDLFNRLFSPYFDYQTLEQNLTSGSFTGPLEDSTTTVIGFTADRPLYSFLMEYQNFDSNLNPSETFKTAASIRKNINPTTSVSVGADYVRKSYSATPDDRSDSYTVTTYGGNLGFRKRFPRRNITLNLTALYWYTDQGSFTASSYYSTGTLSWRLGKAFDLSMGFSLGHRESEIENGNEESDSYGAYITLRRKLF